MRQLPQLRDIASDQQTRGLQATLVIDRDTASRLGISPQTIDNTLYDAFGQRQVSTIYTQLNQYHVVMEVDSTFRDSTDAIQGLYVRSSNGNQVPLSAFTHYETKNTALAVNHQGQFPAVTISFNLGEGVALGDAVTKIESAVLQMGLPSDIHPTFQGNAQAFQSSLSSQPWLILAALVAVYIVLGMLYESYIHPVTILSTLPSAGVGALLALLVSHNELTVIALIGIVLLIGIVIKERHHDDRFCPGSGAVRENARGIHLPGLPAAFSSHHDDDDGGAVRRIAAGADDRHRLGIAPAARHQHRWRDDGQPGSSRCIRRR